MRVKRIRERSHCRLTATNEERTCPCICLTTVYSAPTTEGSVDRAHTNTVELFACDEVRYTAGPILLYQAHVQHMVINEAGIEIHVEKIMMLQYVDYITQSTVKEVQEVAFRANEQNFL